MEGDRRRQKEMKGRKMKGDEGRQRDMKRWRETKKKRDKDGGR